MRKTVFLLIFLGIYNNVNSQITTEALYAKFEINSVAFKDSLIFAGTKGGVYLSVDGGNLWTPTNNGLSKVWVGKLEVSGNNILASSYRIYGYDYGLFLSKNNGKNWEKVSINSKYIRGLVTFKGKVFVGTDSGMVESTDNGLSFTPVTKEFIVNVSDFVTNGEILVAKGGARYNSAYYSSTDGIKWVEVKGDGDEELYADGNFIYTTTCRNGDEICFRREVSVLSSDGKKWHSIDFPARHFAFDKENIYAITVELKDKKTEASVTYKREILMSKDRGKSWKKITENDPLIASNEEIQAKLVEIEAWKPIEIKEKKWRIRGLAIMEEDAKKQRAEALKLAPIPQIIYSAPTPSSSPDYQQQSRQRFNRMHNPKYNPDTKY